MKAPIHIQCIFSYTVLGNGIQCELDWDTSYYAYEAMKPSHFGPPIKTIQE